jgi:hypothetical protein
MPGSARSRAAPGMTGRGFSGRMLKQRRCLGPCAGRASRRSCGGEPRSPENTAPSSSWQARVEGRRVTPTEPGKPASMTNPPCYASKFTAFCCCSGWFGQDRTRPLPWRRGHWASTVTISFGSGSFGQNGWAIVCLGSSGQSDIPRLRQARVRLGREEQALASHRSRESDGLHAQTDLSRRLARA